MAIPDADASMPQALYPRSVSRKAIAPFPQPGSMMPFGQRSSGLLLAVALTPRVVIERGSSSYGAYVPDLPGCVAVGETREEVETLIHEAIKFHIEGMREDGQPVPEPSSTAQLVTIAA